MHTFEIMTASEAIRSGKFTFARYATQLASQRSQCDVLPWQSALLLLVQFGDIFVDRIVKTQIARFMLV